jgi:hypothetical protein
MKTVNLTSYSGTIYVNAGLESQWDTRILGAGKTSTIIKTVSSGYHSTDKFFKTATPNNFQLENLTIEITSNYSSGNENRYIFPFRNNKYLVGKNIAVKAKGIVISDLHLRNHIYFTNCDFTGKQHDLTTTWQTFFLNCTFKNTSSTLQSINSWGSRQVDVSGCHQSDLGTDLEDTGVGRFFSSNGNYQGSKDWYFGNNVAANAGPSGGDVNMGEWLMAENNLTKFVGSPTSATSTTATFASDLPEIFAPDTDLLFAYIIRGKGAGQWKEVLNPNPKPSTAIKVLTIKGSWKVIPDATSVIQIAGCITKVVAYNNTVTGKAGLATSGASNALSLIEPYGNCIDWTADNNQATGYRALLVNFPTQHSANKTDPNMWQCYVNNTAINCRAGGFISGLEYNEANLPPSGPLAIATVIRNLTVTGAIAHDFRYQLPTTAYAYPSIWGIVFENCDMDTPVLVYENDSDTTGASKPAGTIANEVYHSNVVP